MATTRNWLRGWCGLGLCVCWPLVLWGQDADRPARRLPGIQPTGQVLLNTQWSLRPAGKHLVLGDFPVHIARHPDEPFAAVLHAGYGEHGIHIIDLKEQRKVSQVVLPQTFYGICFSPDGRKLYASGAEYEVVHEYKFSGGFLSEPRQIRLGEETEALIPSGLACSPDGKRLYAALLWGHALATVELGETPKVTRLALPKESYPYTVLPSADGSRLFVSLWGASAVAVIDVAKGEVAATWATDQHPTEMVLSPDGEILYVSCANSNHVSVLDADDGDVLETISTALYPQSPPGSTPNAMALSEEGDLLAVANADNNNVALFNVSQRARAKSLGYIPVGWYPTSVRFAHGDSQLLVANGKGNLPKSNRHGPNPLSQVASPTREYIGGLFPGTLAVIDVPSPEEMSRYTKQAFECSPLQKELAPRNSERTADNPIPAKVGDKSPIKHCIYIIKENRTYDQVLGDLPQGNGEASLCLFPDKVTPNHHALAQQFVLLDNFYVESEVSADGHEWSMAAYATDFVEKTWPLSYRGGKRKIGYPSEGSYPIAFPSGGYIWDRCQKAGVSYRSFGEFIDNPAQQGQPATTIVESLKGHFDPFFWGYDLDYTDAKRADRFIAEVQRFEREGGFPQFIVLRLPNDHTYGTRVGKPTPTAMVADNDLALGRVIEAVSRSKFWKETAIFVVEDDAQNGSDHVDAHRTIAFAISPYIKRKSVDSNLYSTSSMLRTMELILGLEPMSQFDAAALPMYASFQAEPDLTPYEHRPAQVDLNETNTRLAWGADLSEKLDLSREDAADDLLFNEIIWRSVKGANSRMPAPVRASFVLVHPEDEDDEEDEDEEEEEREREAQRRREQKATK